MPSLKQILRLTLVSYRLWSLAYNLLRNSDGVEGLYVMGIVRLKEHETCFSPGRTRIIPGLHKAYWKVRDRAGCRHDAGGFTRHTAAALKLLGQNSLAVPLARLPSLSLRAQQDSTGSHYFLA